MATRAWGGLLVLLVSFTALGLLQPTTGDAHSGGIDSQGGHNCRVGPCAGTYHCHRAHCFDQLEKQYTYVVPDLKTPSPNIEVEVEEGKSLRDIAVAVFWGAIFLGGAVWFIWSWWTWRGNQ